MNDREDNNQAFKLDVYPDGIHTDYTRVKCQVQITSNRVDVLQTIVKLRQEHRLSAVLSDILREYFESGRSFKTNDKHYGVDVKLDDLIKEREADKQTIEYLTTEIHKIKLMLMNGSSVSDVTEKVKQQFDNAGGEPVESRAAQTLSGHMSEEAADAVNDFFSD